MLYRYVGDQRKNKYGGGENRQHKNISQGRGLIGNRTGIDLFKEKDQNGIQRDGFKPGKCNVLGTLHQVPVKYKPA